MLHPECLAGEFFAGLDPRRGTHLATLLPADKERNADRRRRALGDPTAATAAEPAPPPAGIAPLLRQSYPKTIYAAIRVGQQTPGASRYASRCSLARSGDH